MKYVFVHGFCENAGMWQGFSDHLCVQEDAIVLDLPGFGEHGALAIESVDAWADWMHEQLQEVEEPLVWIGHSMGGYVGAAFAEKYPDKLKGLVMLHSSFSSDSKEKRDQREKTISFVERNGPSAFLSQFVPQLFRKDKAGKEEWLERAVDLVGQTKASSIIDASKAMMNRPERINWLKSSSLPICMIIGRYDAHLAFRKQLTEASLIQRGAINILEESGHMGMWEEAERCAHAISSFIDHHLS